MLFDAESTICQFEIQHILQVIMQANPFATKKPSDPKKPNMFDDFFSKTEPPTLISIDPARKGKITPKVFPSANHQQQNINSNTKQERKVAPKSLQTKNLIIEMFQQHQAQNPALANLRPSHQRLTLQVRVDNTPCQVIMEGQTYKLADLEQRNLRINCMRPLKCLSERAAMTQKIAQCLAELYSSIRLNNAQLLAKITNRKCQPLDYLFTSKEINRLLQGLLFYKPKNHKLIQLLARLMQGRVLGQQVAYIAQTYNLDVLKAYYAVKQVYIAQKMLPAGLRDFQADLQRNQLLGRQRLGDLVGQFLKTDKTNLLLIYGTYLNGNRKPSKFNICRVEEEVRIIWANIHMMKGQSSQIQQMVFKLYLKYSQFEHVESYLYAQIQSMKKSFKLANQLFNHQILELSIEKMLKEGNFNENQCKDHYLDLFRLLIRRQPIDYEQAIKRLAQATTLHEKWLDYFRIYVKQVEFNQGKTKQITKAVYIYKISKMLYSKNCCLDQDLQHRLVKQIYNKCSVILGLKFLGLMSSNSLKMWSLRFLLKFSESDIERMQEQDSYILQKLIPDQYRSGTTVSALIQLIETTFRSYIENEDLPTLQTMISSGKNLTYSFVTDQFQLQSIKYYTRVFYKFPSQQLKIQANINNLFKTLKKQHVNIEISLVSYNNNLLSQVRTREVIARHLVFLVEVVEAEKKAAALQRWLDAIEKQEFQDDFQWFTEVLVRITDTLQNGAQIYLLMAFIERVLALFKSAILNAIDRFKFSQGSTKKFQLLLTLRTIRSWFQILGNAESQQLTCFIKEIKSQICQNIKTPLQVLYYPGLPMSQKLIIFAQLVNNQDLQFCNSNFARCIISDLLAQEKTVNIFDLYKMVAKQLRGESSLQPLLALYTVTQLQESLAKLLIQQNIVQLASSLTCQDHPNLVDLEKVTKLGVSLHCYLPNSQPHQRQKIYIFFHYTQDKLFLWLKKQKMTTRFFRSLFELISLAKNSLPYNYHISYLIKAKNYKYLVQLSPAQYKNLGLYALYILSLRLSKHPCAVQIGNQQQRQLLMQEIRVFTQIQLSLIAYFGNAENKESMNQMCFKYISKLNKVLIQCTKQPFINEVAINLLRKLKRALDASTLSTNNLIKKQLALAQKYLQVNFEYSAACYIPYCPIQLLRCKSVQNFNQILAKSLNQLNARQQEQLFSIQISKISSFITNNSQFAIDYIGISAKVLELNPFSPLFIDLIHRIVSNLNPEYYEKRNNKHIIKELVRAFQLQIKSLTDLQNLCCARHFIRLVNKIMSTGLLSSFEVSEKFGQTITQIFLSLRRILFKWSASNLPSLKPLNQLSLILTHYPFGANFSKTFTLWNMIEYRQKLFFIDQILRYCRETNGLLDIKKYGLIQTIVQYTSFLKLNSNCLTSKLTLEKISVINKLVKGNSMSPSNLLNFIDKQFSLSQLKLSTWQIAQHLNYLNFQETSFQVQFFEYFNPSLALQ